MGYILIEISNRHRKRKLINMDNDFEKLQKEAEDLLNNNYKKYHYEILKRVAMFAK